MQPTKQLDKSKPIDNQLNNHEQVNDQANKSAKETESTDKQKPILSQTQTHNTCISILNGRYQKHIPEKPSYTSVAALNPLKVVDKL